MTGERRKGEGWTHPVRPGEVLAVVDGKVEVVERVVGGAVDDVLEPVARDHVRVVDEDGPDVDDDEDCLSPDGETLTNENGQGGSAKDNGGGVKGKQERGGDARPT
jgi:hypothetical protein